MPSAQLHDPLMTGLHLPARLGRGKAKPELRAQWIELVATLMARGVKTPSHLRRLLGLNFRTAKNWMDEVEALWARGVSDELLNVRRESLYNEADEVAKEAWRAAMVAETASAKASLLKVLLMANQRKASLTGLDSIEVRVNKRVEQHTTVELVARVEQDHGLAPGALEALGRSAARLLSAPAEEPRALLARPAEPLVVDVK